MNREMYQIIYYDLDMLKCALNVLTEKKDKEFEFAQGYKYAYILHDKDVTKDGKYKKAHYHLVLKFTGPVKSDRLYAMLKDFLPNGIHEDLNKANAGSWAYLIHANDLKKFPYQFDDIVTNIDVDDLYDYIEKHRTISVEHKNGYNVRQVIDFCYDNEITSLKKLVYALLSRGMYDLLGWVSKNTYFVNSIIPSKRDFIDDDFDDTE